MYKVDICSQGWKSLFLIIFLFLFLNFSILNVFGSDSYADIEIDITDSGIVDINGITNLEEFSNIIKSQNFTSKNKKYWKFELISNDIVGDYVYRINLPEGAIVNYINLDKNFRLEQHDNKISLIGIGENKKINVTIQYEIVSNDSSVSIFSNYSYYYLFLVIIILFSFGIYFYSFKKNNKDIEQTNSNKTIDEKKIDLNKELLEDVPIVLDDRKDNGDNKMPVESYINPIYEKLSIRQKDIVDLLNKNKLLNMKEIEELMMIPKSSISRNVKSLELYGLVVKQRIGKCVYIKLKK